MKSSPSRTKAVQIETMPFDGAKYLKDEEDMAALLGAALEDGDTRVIAAAIRDIAHSQNMGRLAKASGLSGEIIHGALSSNGTLDLDVFIKIVRALGLQLHATVITG